MQADAAFIDGGRHPLLQVGLHDQKTSQGHGSKILKEQMFSYRALIQAQVKDDDHNQHHNRNEDEELLLQLLRVLQWILKFLNDSMFRIPGELWNYSVLRSGRISNVNRGNPRMK